MIKPSDIKPPHSASEVRRNGVERIEQAWIQRLEEIGAEGVRLMLARSSNNAHPTYAAAFVRVFVEGAENTAPRWFVEAWLNLKDTELERQKNWDRFFQRWGFKVTVIGTIAAIIAAVYAVIGFYRP